MRVLIQVPQENAKWALSFGKGSRKRNSASVILNAIERRLHAYAVDEKVTIKVKYGKGTTNTTIPSLDAKYLLYATSCFLEDYLSKEVLLRFLKQYAK